MIARASRITVPLVHPDEELHRLSDRLRVYAAVLARINAAHPGLLENVEAGFGRDATEAAADYPSSAAFDGECARFLNDYLAFAAQENARVMSAAAVGAA